MAAKWNYAATSNLCEDVERIQKRHLRIKVALTLSGLPNDGMTSASRIQTNANPHT